MCLGEYLEDLACHECCKHVILLRLDLLVLTLLDETKCITDVHAHVVEGLKALGENVTCIHQADGLRIDHVCIELLSLLDVSLPAGIELWAVLDGTWDKAALV